MRPTIRFLLLWLMALALPVQGWAAAAGQHCAAMHERMQVSAGPHHEGHSGHDGHEAHDAAAGHHHDAEAVVGHAAVDGDAASHEGSPSQAGAASVKCSACAACCAAVGLPASVPHLPSPPPVGVQAVATEPAAVAFLTGGLERPPRAVLA